MSLSSIVYIYVVTFSYAINLLPVGEYDKCSLSNSFRETKQRDLCKSIDENYGLCNVFCINTAWLMDKCLAKKHKTWIDFSIDDIFNRQEQRLSIAIVRQIKKIEKQRVMAGLTGMKFKVEYFKSSSMNVSPML
uniref:Uncharacterized protein n=1 Tax=Glossina palpalis gambiensis TaxID=67801 RepID=A0A1B0APP1_9MUSC